jgi:predicted transcriptional regulator of viral defense system
MNELEFLQRKAFFTTREYALYLGKQIASASRTLSAYARAGSLVQVTRGVWANKSHKEFSPYGAIPYLLANEHGYVSFLSALHRHGLISQIPTAIQVATTGRGRILKSPIGEFQFFKMKPQLFRVGVEAFAGKLNYNIATPEKALLDTFYLSTKRGNRFRKLPEIELDGLQSKLFLKWLKAYPLKSQQKILESFRQRRAQ